MVSLEETRSIVRRCGNCPWCASTLETVFEKWIATILDRAVVEVLLALTWLRSDSGAEGSLTELVTVLITPKDSGMKGTEGPINCLRWGLNHGRAPPDELGCCSIEPVGVAAKGEAIVMYSSVVQFRDIFKGYVGDKAFLWSLSTGRVIMLKVTGSISGGRPVYHANPITSNILQNIFERHDMTLSVVNLEEMSLLVAGIGNKNSQLEESDTGEILKCHT
ncbi:hypothetical protein [Bacillus mycoides]|uniref:hypothetical protein n=1 Tax=Bacillus mycoides TaxID=1405 RepID=UPI003D64F7A4